MGKSQFYRKPHQFKRKKIIFQSLNFWFALLAFALLLGFLYFLLFSHFFQVEKVVVTNEKRVSKEELKSFVEGQLEKEVLFFPTKSIFLVNEREIEREALKAFPLIAKVEVKKSLPRTLNVIIVERLEKAVWCQTTDCFLVDTEGIIFERSESKPGLVLIQNQGETNFNLGERVIEKDLLLTILEVGEKLSQSLKIEVAKVIVFPEYFKVETLEGWLIHFNPAGDLDWQLTKLGAVLEEKIPQERKKDLEYIELRFGNLAPFKYRATAR